MLATDQVSTWAQAEDWARAQDGADPLAGLRDAFELPEGIYCCGHSLGPLPRRARTLLTNVLDDWGTIAVEGHHRAQPPWAEYAEPLARSCAALIGAQPEEVVVMGALSTNLHLMLASFYRPRGRRRKILIERPAFPSDRYAVVSQLRWHGLDPARDLIQADTGKLPGHVAAAGDELALVLLGGMNYYSGEALDLAACAHAAHAVGALVGFDLAHAIGNVPIDLRAADADFAVWCGYKYLCGGPGAPAGCYVNRRHFSGPAPLPRLAGWWGNCADTRFEMREEFEPAPGAAGWNVSCPSILSLAGLKAGLELFDQVPLATWQAKSRALQRATEAWADELLPHWPRLAPPRRGAQISLQIGPAAGSVQQRLRVAGVFSDSRGDVLRLSFHPLYNRFQDVAAAFAALRQLR
ncbi:MAG: kynureninase [Terriglobales bacterium]